MAFRQLPKTAFSEEARLIAYPFVKRFSVTVTGHRRVKSINKRRLQTGRVPRSALGSLVGSNARRLI